MFKQHYINAITLGRDKEVAEYVHFGVLYLDKVSIYNRFILPSVIVEAHASLTQGTPFTTLELHTVML